MRRSDNWCDHAARHGFTCLVAEENGGLITGVTWFNTMTIEELATEFGEQGLAQFLTSRQFLAPVVYIRGTIVGRNFQGRGMARLMKVRAIATIRESFRKITVFTCMWDDNVRIVHLNEELGFRRTNIKVPSKRFSGVTHEYRFPFIED